MLEKYGDDLHDQIDDAELWAKTQKEIRGASKNNYIYGVGSSDLGFVVTGKLSAAAGCSSSFCGSQHEVYLFNIYIIYIIDNETLCEHENSH